MFLSLSFSLLYPLSKNKQIKYLKSIYSIKAGITYDTKECPYQTNCLKLLEDQRI